MKTRFNTYDIICGVAELQKLVGQRVNQIYDVDNKTYLIRFQGGSEKCTLLIESGVRFHTTAFEWPKNVAPSGFSMKLRKHLKNKRLESLRQLGADRIIDLQFGVGEAAYHIILELYDRGNIILADHELTILYILRPHTEGEELRFAIREKYPKDRAKQQAVLPSRADLENRIKTNNESDSLYYFIMSLVDCGPAVVEHVLTKRNLNNCVFATEQPKESTDAVDSANTKKKQRKSKKHASTTAKVFNLETDMQTLYEAIQEADNMVKEAAKAASKGFIIRKMEEKISMDGSANTEHFYQNLEYHPYLFKQFENQPIAEFDTFMLAVDEFYSTLEGQRIDMKTLQQERDAYKKLLNVKQDHAKRLEELNKAQEVDKIKAELIRANLGIVDSAIVAVKSAIAIQMPWPAVQDLVKSAQANGDPIAAIIKQIKFETNHITLQLTCPYSMYEDNDDDDDDGDEKSMLVEVDLSLSAWGNARKYYDLKRTAAHKEQKTIDASQKALKSAERKTQQTLKDVRTVSAISKARKVYWFEKFYWFISSENYLVIGGRDAQQNELIVKRYMRASDIYVHAEIQGASSVIIRNHSTTASIPPKTLVEAGTMAISYSVAWDAKVITNAYWVHSNQVSKTAPSGEYLGTGSFMIRGKKNFLPTCHLIMGLSLLFKIDEGNVEQHRGERKVRTIEEEEVTPDTCYTQEDKEVELNSDSEDEEKLIKTEENIFPNTEIKIDHGTGRVQVKAGVETVEKKLANVNLKNEVLMSKLNEESIEEAIIIAAAPSRKKSQQNSKKRKDEKSKQKQERREQQEAHMNEKKDDNAQPKRGQNSKSKKKLKAKYKKEELFSSGLGDVVADNEKPTTTEKINETETENEVKNEVNVKKVTFKESPQRKQQKPQEIPAAADADENEDIPIGADLELLETLTGQPFEDDELLFAIPVVAPYQALHNYKFKVKLTPGTGKRGRAAKTALMMFSKEKSCSAREKDLLKSIKEESLARNIPGKVKLSTPQLQKYKK